MVKTNQAGISKEFSPRCQFEFMPKIVQFVLIISLVTIVSSANGPLYTGNYLEYLERISIANQLMQYYTITISYSGWHFTSNSASISQAYVLMSI